MTAKGIFGYTAHESGLACGLNFVFEGQHYEAIFNHVWRAAFWL